MQPCLGQPARPPAHRPDRARHGADGPRARPRRARLQEWRDRSQCAGAQWAEQPLSLVPTQVPARVPVLARGPARVPVLARGPTRVQVPARAQVPVPVPARARPVAAVGVSALSRVGARALPPPWGAFGRCAAPAETMWSRNSNIAHPALRPGSCCRQPRNRRHMSDRLAAFWFRLPQSCDTARPLTRRGLPLCPLLAAPPIHSKGVGRPADCNGCASVA